MGGLPELSTQAAEAAEPFVLFLPKLQVPEH